MQTTNVKFTPIDVTERKALDFRAGDTVKVFIKVQEKGKTRLQAFEGLVICRKHGTEQGATFTVRKVASGVGTERIFPLFSPMIDKLEVVKRSKVRQSKLYHLREKAAKEIRRQMRRIRMEKDEPEVAEIIEDTEPEESVKITPEVINEEKKTEKEVGVVNK